MNQDRKGFLGSADAYTIYKGHPMALLNLWEEKVGLKESSNVVTTAMQHGIDTEGQARAMFSSIMNKVYWPQRLYHSEYRWMRASLDGINFEGTCGVEIKCPTNPILLENAKRGVFDESHEIQMQHQMAVSGLDMIYYFIYISEEINYVVPFIRDNDLIEELIKKERAFWECIENKTPPVTERDDEEWTKEEEIYASLCIKEKEIEKEKKESMQRLKFLSNGNSVIGRKILLTRYFRKGNIKYSDIPELKGVNLEQYRGDDIEVVSANIRKQKNEE